MAGHNRTRVLFAGMIERVCLPELMAISRMKSKVGGLASDVISFSASRHASGWRRIVLEIGSLNLKKGPAALGPDVAKIGHDLKELGGAYVT